MGLHTRHEHLLRINDTSALQVASRQRHCARSWQPCNHQVPLPRLE